jgi:hypothetical protein
MTKRYVLTEPEVPVFLLISALFRVLTVVIDAM